MGGSVVSGSEVYMKTSKNSKKSSRRQSGILMPISSIPSKYGIGGFSKEAYAFVDFLEAAGQKLWQILPLGPTSYGDSPYQSFSTFAGNPYYIDLEGLIGAGYLTEKECGAVDCGSDPSYVDYEKIWLTRFKLLRKAYERAKKAGLPQEQGYLDFIGDNESWLPDYALYMAVKSHFKYVSWVEWDEDIRLRKPAALKKYRQELADEIGFYQFQQYFFAAQWKALKAYANEKGIRIVGDIPIYVAFDSADTWANPELFQLDEDNVPLGVAGCPPDVFCATGQLWGNPLYRWEYHRQTGYAWWISRIAYCFRLYDVVRIDHFRGFESYWFVPYGDDTAQYGHWVKGPGYDLFRALREALGDMDVIAEDLGFLTKEVIALVKKTGYPGMKILQFAFGDDADNAYLPHNYTQNSIVYTGTHDNETILGWYKGTDAGTRRSVKRYLNIRGNREIPWHFIRAAFASVADTAVIPMQDYLELDNAARINTPSTLGGNWEWRMLPDAATPELAGRIRELVETYGRG